MTNSLALVPVFAGTINSHSVQLCDVRTLHTFMIVLRDFTTWIKGRIRKFGFIEGVDFITVKNLSSPDLVSAKSRAQTLADYHLTLDMAKELAMVENNDKGREARRYFIDCEKQTPPTRPMLTYARISPAQAQSLKELVASVVATGKQGYPDTWARLQKKFRVNSYLELGADQFEDACAYLTAKLPDAPDQQQTAINATDGPALKAARDVALRYFDDLRGAIKSGGGSAGMGQIPGDVLTGLVADALMRQRFLVTFDFCNGGMQARPVPADAMVLTPDNLPKLIRQHEDPTIQSALVAEINHACADRQQAELAEYKKHSQWLSKKLAAVNQKAVTQ